MPIVLRAAPCIHIADHLSRKANLNYGILLGKSFSNKLIICEAFDLKITNGEIDGEFLQKKLLLHQKVSPHLSLAGVYSVKSTGLPDSSFFSNVPFTRSDYPLLYLEMPEVNTTKCYSVETGDLMNLTLSPGEAETIAVSTVQNHPNYTQEDQELTQENGTLLAQALAQLNIRVENSLLNNSLDPEQERKLVRLAQMLANYKATSKTENFQLTTSHICLLASELSAVTAATAQVNKRITGLSKTR